MLFRIQAITRAGARWYFFEFAAVVFTAQAVMGAGLERVTGLSMALAFAGIAAFQKTGAGSGWRRVVRCVFLLVGVPLVGGGLLLFVFSGFLAWRGFTHPEAGTAVLAALVLAPGALIPIVGGWILIQMGRKADGLTVKEDLLQVLPGRFSSTRVRRPAEEGATFADHERLPVAPTGSAGGPTSLRPQ